MVEVESVGEGPRARGGAECVGPGPRMQERPEAPGRAEHGGGASNVGAELRTWRRGLGVGVGPEF